ncbi:hypothetical protein DFJ73DRAFT_842247 [Zopfochytrium polystomum]|nr:hypothetical protein DFJ73DRAFT_842247 [Zopfochytrium polystomum]
MDRRKRERSSSATSSTDERRKKRRSPSPRSRGADNGDHYIPNYERDGYVPAPRRTGMAGGGGMGPDRGGYGNNVGFEMFNMYGKSNGGRMMEDPLELDYMVPFRQYAEFLKSKSRSSRQPEPDEEEMRKKYQTYKENFQSKILTSFFEEHKSSDWFREKYHPIDSKPLKDEINGRKRELFPVFLNELQQGRLDHVCFDDVAAKSSSTPAAPADPSADTEIGDADDAMLKASSSVNVDEASKTHLPPPIPVNGLFLKAVPPTVKREQISELFKSYEGFSHLALSDPRPDKKFYRLGWLVFREGTNLEKAMQDLNGKQIDDFVVSLAMHTHQSIRSRIIPLEFNTEARLETDLANARRLATALDVESGIQELEGKGCECLEARLTDVVFKTDEYREEVAEDEEKGDDQKPSSNVSERAHQISVKMMKKRLDLHIEYLRRVHWYDYYSGIEAAGPEDFNRRTWVYLRRPIPPGGVPPETNLNKYAKSDFQRLSERLDTRIVLRTLVLSDSWGGDDLLKLGGKDPEAELNRQLAAKHIAKVDTEKYRCKDCSKLFRGEEFVQKHIKAKHPRLAEEVAAEVEFFNSYVRDPNRVHYTYVQPPVQAPGAMGGAPGSFGDMSGMGSMMGAVAMGMQTGAGMGMMGIPSAMAAMGMGMPQMAMGMGWGNAFMSSMMAQSAAGMMMGSRGGRGGRIQSRLGPRPVRSSEPLPVDPRARTQRAYDDLDSAPKGDIGELNYD